MLREYFDAFSYELMGKEPERFYHAIFHSVFVMAGIHAIPEDRGEVCLGVAMHRGGISFSSEKRKIAEWISI